MKHVITGGPGTGKTSGVKELSGRYHTVPETARILMEAGRSPEEDLLGFEREVADLQTTLESFASEPAFLDRSLVDIIAYCEVFGEEPWPGLYESIAEADYDRVFFMERLPAHLYETDGVRKEDPGLAARIHQTLHDVYDRLGFDIVEVPYIEAGTAGEGIKQRADYIERHSFRYSGKEVEGKYRADHADVKDALSRYEVIKDGEDRLENHVHDLYGMLREDGTLRVREGTEDMMLTLKGANNGSEVNEREEHDILISEEVYRFFRGLPEASRYTTVRETYVPFGDPSARICLDLVEGLGSFIEIEAPSEHQVLLWKDRLGIESRNIRTSYSEMARQEKNL